MTPALLLASAVEPAISYLAAQGVPSDDRARVMLLAIAAQECGLGNRCQVSAGGVRGPAHGLWQFERGGGVAGVLRHPVSSGYANRACRDLLVAPTPEAVWAAIEHNDVLAACFARLLLLTDARSLPADSASGYAYYKDLWRPGKPDPSRWPAAWAMALGALKRGP